MKKLLPLECVVEITATAGAYESVFSGCPADLALSGSVNEGVLTMYAERDGSTFCLRGLIPPKE